MSNEITLCKKCINNKAEYNLPGLNALLCKLCSQDWMVKTGICLKCKKPATFTYHTPNPVYCIDHSLIEKRYGCVVCNIVLSKNDFKKHDHL
jgi:hypothetical protein